MAAITRTKKIIMRCGLFGLGCLVAFGLSELLLRLAGFSPPIQYVPDDLTGTRLRPGWTGSYSKEGHASVSINRAGFRDRDHALEKPPGTTRILVLGDSYVEALQVPVTETFWSILEQQLGAEADRKGKKIEVLSMGVSGWGTAQERLALEHFGFTYSPDVVVLAFFSGNDLRNNSKQLESFTARPFYALRGDELALDNSFHEHPSFLRAKSSWTNFKTELVEHSRLVQVLSDVRQNWTPESRAKKARAQAGLDDRCFLEPADENWKEAWNVTERLILAMNEVCRKRRVKFCVMTVTNPIQVHPDPAVRGEYMRRIGAEHLDYADHRIRALTSSHDIPAVILADRLRAHAESQHEYLHGFANATLGEGHWNVAGHRLAGQILAEELQPFLFEQTSDPRVPGSEFGDRGTK